MTDKRMKFITSFSIVLLFMTCWGLLAIDSGIERYELENGATLLMLPIEGVPAVSCITLTDVGGVRERAGITGISHYLEHMAFKGTETIGTRDIVAEKKALEDCHRIFDIILEERKKKDEADEDKLASLSQELQQAVEYANEYVIGNEFSQLIELNGGKGLTAVTSQDMTYYSVCLPANKLELWMLMEAERFTKPVLREFYQERDVILEERRMGYSNPVRKFFDEMINFTFINHPYRYSVIGDEEDIKNLTVRDLEAYYNELYGAKNLVFAIVGDIDSEKALEMAKKYLASIPSGEKSEKVEINEPVQLEEREFVYEMAAQPVILVAYHMPSAIDADYPIYLAIADLLGHGRSSRLHKVMVEEKRLAVTAFAYPGMPGNAYQNLFFIGAIPAPGVDLNDCLAEIDNQLQLLMTENVTNKELEGYRNRALKSSYKRWLSRKELARQMAHYEVLFGDYRLMYDELKNIQNIDEDDISRVLETTFRRENRVVGKLKTRGAK